MDYTLESMRQEHRQQVMEIYNYFIEKSFAAYPESRLDDSVFDRFLALSQGFSAVVVKDKKHTVVGFAFLQPYHPADSFQKTAVITYFIMPEHTRKGLGARILDVFIKESRKKGIEIFMANISSLNPVSIEFHRKNGFHKCGKFEDIGTKAGKDFSVVWMQRRI